MSNAPRETTVLGAAFSDCDRRLSRDRKEWWQVNLDRGAVLMRTGSWATALASLELEIR